MAAAAAQACFLSTDGHGGNFTWHGLYGGVAYNDTLVPVTPGLPTHLAVVRDSGTTNVYVNGVSQFTSVGGPNAPAGAFTIGGFDGRVDEVSVGTFAAGTFNPTTDLNFVFSNSPNFTQLYSNGFEAGDAGKFSSSGNGGVFLASAYGITTTEGTQLFSFNGGEQPPNAVVTSSVIEGQAGADTYVYFDYGNYGANVEQSLLVEVLDADDNSVIYSQQLSDGVGSNTVDLFSPFFLNFTSTTDDFLLRFSDVSGGTGSSDGLLDNIRVSQLQAVPEPTSIAIWSLIGLIMTAVCWRRRSPR